MDSLLATYASSDEDDGDQHPSAPTHPLPSPSPFPSPSLFSSLSAPPKNKSSSSSSTSSSLFSLLPPPKFGKATKLDPPTSNSNPSKKVVFLKPTWASPDLGSDDDKEEGEKKAKARKNQFSTVSGSNALSLPPPKYSFSAAPSSSGRRALIESNTAAPASVAPPVAVEKVETASYGEKSASLAVDAADTANYGYYPVDGSAETAASSGVDGAAGADYGYYAADRSADYYPDSGVDGYGAGYAQHGAEWGKAVVVDSAPAADFVFGDGRRGKGKRGRNEVPLEVMEVKQDELMKNRPREDQSKMTGIAFGPGYQPVSSTKGKPNKLHKRKHQIGSLYFDMKQKEMELAERRSRGFQTKAETQGKYGW